MRRSSAVNGLALAATVGLAAGFWFVTFYLDWGVFWFKISASALMLTALSVWLQPFKNLSFPINWRSIALGIGSAAVLYLVFWAGKAVSTAVLPFAADQIGAVYGKGEGTPLPVIALLLFFVTSPCEELYWRGFLQRQLALRFGAGKGWLLATALYAGVHIWSFNFMLIGAAGVAGAFWGLMYRRFQDMTALIISHAVWSTVVFAVLPIP